MPELPEVETVCRGIRSKLIGGRILHAVCHRPNLRIPFPPRLNERLEGAIIETVSRRAKYILIALSTEDILIIHLGMSGRILLHDRVQTRLKHDHFVIQTDRGVEMVFNDPRRFGMVDLCAADDIESHRFFKHLGPEPLSNAFSPDMLEQALKGKKTAIKPALLDQRLVVGIGNIYASEALYVAGIDPRRPAGELSSKEIARLVPAIRDVLNQAIEAGGSSLKNYVNAEGGLGYFQHRWAVYSRAGRACPDCNCDVEKNGGIVKINQTGRATFYCPRRQS